MELKKRKAEDQLIPESPKSKQDLNQDENRNNEENPDTNKVEQKPATFGFGFSNYAKINPFAAAIAENRANNDNPFNLKNKTAPTIDKSIIKSTLSMPPPLSVPSPKSPNPFSSPSPPPNPFMTIVESKDELWNSMSKNKKENFFFGSKYKEENKESQKDGQNLTKHHRENENLSEKNESEDKIDEKDDAKEDNECESPGRVYTKIVSLPENVPVITGEENELCSFQIRAKLYRLSFRSNPASQSQDDHSKKILEQLRTSDNSSTENKESEDKISLQNSNKDLANSQSDINIDFSNAEWVEVGVGPLKILQNDNPNGDKEDTNRASTGRLVMRREDKKGGIGTKLILNTRLNKYLTISRQSEKMIKVVCINYADVEKENILKPFLIKTKTTQESDELFNSISKLIRPTTI